MKVETVMIGHKKYLSIDDLLLLMVTEDNLKNSEEIKILFDSIKELKDRKRE